MKAPRTRHFRASEFSSPRVYRDDNGRTRVDRERRVPVPSELWPGLAELMRALETIRAELGGAPISIVSGWRTVEFNRRNPGRSPRSKHLQAIAADIRVRGKSNSDVLAAIKRLIKQGRIPQGGLAGYHGDKRYRYVHYDIRGRRARWGQRS